MSEIEDGLKSSTTQNFSQDQIQNLANDPRNIVCQYEFDEAPVVRKSEEVRYLLEETLEKYVAKRQAQPTYCDKAIRREIIAENENLKEFEKTHGRIFEKFTDRNSTASDLEPIYLMLDLIAKREELKDKNAQDVLHNQQTAFLHQHLAQRFNTGMSYEEYQRLQENSTNNTN